jgi:tRNA(fMet)-specific endonuclease VapC
MSRTVLDTDILSDLLRRKNVHVLERADAYLRTHGRLSTTSITVFEVLLGRQQAGQFDRATEFLAWTTNAEVLSFDTACAKRAAEIAGALQRSGQGVGTADVLIAATAIVHDVTLATANVSHYQRIAPFGLRIENWRDPISSA